MNIISFAAGIILFLLGFSYIYRPSAVYKFNLIMREYFFNDRLLIVNRRKIGVLLIVAGGLILYFTF